MTRETGSYVAALTSNRDQLRGHLAVLGDTLASTHDLQRILRVILHSAIGATGARAGAVLLVETGGCSSPSAPRVWTGVGRRRTRTDRRRPGAGGCGVVGAVAATGEPQRGGWSRPTPRRVSRVAARTSRSLCHAGRRYPGHPRWCPGDAGRDPGSGRRGWRRGRARRAGPLRPVGRRRVRRRRPGHPAYLRRSRGRGGGQRPGARGGATALLTDPLTGLWNYRYLRESIRREVERASRFGRMLSVLALDLDRFKDVNDTYGHAAGTPCWPSSPGGCAARSVRSTCLPAGW
ncbi:GGDEF domain-containing protein [Micromonospora sp. M12]